MKKCITFAISLMLFCSCVQKDAKFAYKQLENGYYCIPVEINGKEKLFLFDTGCEGTIINYPVMKECGIQLEDSAPQRIHTAYGSTAGITHYSNIRLSIGGIPFISTVAADNYNRQMIKYTDYDEFDGILGVKDIQKFNWLFNFEQETVTLSVKPISFQTASDDQVLNLDFSKKKKVITYVNLALNDSVEHTFLFDTGCLNTIKTNIKKKQHSELNGDFMLLPPLKEYIKKRIPNCISIDNLLLIDSLKINNVQLSHLSSQRSDSIILADNLITNEFLRRFRLMYYDSTNRRICLYVSPQDTTVYRGENEKRIIDAIISAIRKKIKGEVKKKQQ